MILLLGVLTDKDPNLSYISCFCWVYNETKMDQFSMTHPKSGEAFVQKGQEEYEMRKRPSHRSGYKLFFLPF